MGNFNPSFIHVYKNSFASFLWQYFLHSGDCLGLRVSCYPFGCIFYISYEYWLHERVVWEIVTPRNPMSTEGWQYFPCYPLVQSMIIISYRMLFNYIVYITFGFKTIQFKWIYARTVHHRVWLASYERLNLRSTKYKFKYLLDLDCLETKRM